MERLGYQLDAANTVGASPVQIIIMPFLTEARTDTGILAARWLEITTQILTAVRSAVQGSQGPVDVSGVVVSSFSAGYIYSENFRLRSGNLGPLMTQVWDFDGFPKQDSSNLHSTTSYTAVKYDNATNEPGSIHLPSPRWSQYPSPAPAYPPEDPNDPLLIHHRIRDFMLLHAAVTHL
jgi:hypothetical protein